MANKFITADLDKNVILSFLLRQATLEFEVIQKIKRFWKNAKYDQISLSFELQRTVQQTDIATNNIFADQGTLQ